MNMKRFVANCLSLPILAIAFAAQAQSVPFDLEVGYRWLDLNGSSQMYRTQINERGRPLLRSFTMSTGDFEGHTSLIDRFRVDASDLGAGPAQSLRLEASRAGTYRLASDIAPPTPSARCPRSQIRCSARASSPASTRSTARVA